MARQIKYAATHFSIAFSMSYAANQNVLTSAVIGVVEPVVFAVGSRWFRGKQSSPPVRSSAASYAA
ncbi:putative membrane protein [Luteibacter sp. Sphag1AF]|uniref:DUF2061 domain-containing protein n=1 Tax=Luteibacter sp. Sphag1AF TaxID=2587031 RepID=UPI00161ED0FF|nr:DUF2061 domain-containing protein [Luteibacter sp. Sphag1AF]MBB3227733.1 putative membrane protein [Luteibacter sp. Sphag1AF]